MAGSVGKRNSPLDAYLDDVRRHPLLTPEEEREITRRYVKDRNPADGRRMVISNLRLVVKVAKEYPHTRVPLIDLVQEGNLGLLHAIEKYDPEKGVRFASYAVYWIRAYILRHLMQNHSMVKVGTSRNQRKLFYNLKKEMSRLEAEGIKPTAKLIAANLDVHTAEVILMQTRLAGGNEVSLEAPAGKSDEDARSLGDLIADGRPTTEEWAARAEIRAQLLNSLDAFAETLNLRQRSIWDQRVRSDEPLTLRALGAELGVSGEQVRLTEIRIRRSLRRHLQAKFPGLELGDVQSLGG